MIRALALLFLWWPLAVAEEEARPRVVSLDYCADQFVLGLADPEQILAVSHGADKPHSYLRDKAKGVRQIRSATEDVIALNPDIVVSHWGADARALAMYERFGIKVHQIGWASNLDAAREETRRAGDVLGQAARAAVMIAKMPEQSASSGESVLYVTPGGLTSGDATLVGAVIRHAGLLNAVGSGSWQALPLEDLLMTPPQVAVTAFFGFDTDKQDQWSVTRHPLMRRALSGARSASLNEARIICPAWFVADEAAALAEALK